MGFLSGKKILVTGVASNRSIAWGCAEAMHREGAEIALTYQNDKLKSRVEDMAAKCDSNLTFPLDVGSDEDIEALFAALAERWDGLDGIVHSVAFAPREQLEGDYVDAVTREGFSTAHDISSYSFAALAKAGRGMMQGRNGALVTMTYLAPCGPFPTTTSWGWPRRVSRRTCVISRPLSVRTGRASTPSPPVQSARLLQPGSRTFATC